MTGVAGFQVSITGRFWVSTEGLLENPDVKLIEVAFELGYSDPAHFTRAFRRWAGVAPREFRQGCRAGNDRDEADGRRRGARA
jgi:hypothetical protein